MELIYESSSTACPLPIQEQTTIAKTMDVVRRPEKSQRPNSAVLLPNGKFNFCTIHFSNSHPDYFKNRASYNTEKEKRRCSNQSCPIYPKCFGYDCPFKKRDIACRNQIEKYKTFLREFFL